MYTQYEAGLYLIEFAIFGSMLVFASMAWYFVRSAVYYGGMLLFAVLRALMMLLVACILLGAVVLAVGLAAPSSSVEIGPVRDDSPTQWESTLNFVLAFALVNFIATLIGALMAVYYQDEGDD
jgi:hypothetical protein